MLVRSIAAFVILCWLTLSYLFWSYCLFFALLSLILTVMLYKRAVDAQTDFINSPHPDDPPPDWWVYGYATPVVVSFFVTIQLIAFSCCLTFGLMVTSFALGVWFTTWLYKD